ncbi:hypothetical protein F511_34675 [Dorcoceras hygrometricum]|uniref:Uncharacterized protein n=1 Tax=Dorcoceras hygrometricum TaxID=472368 RepID=A0A2Z7AXK8_9LAMI|nr:hypothetical protein F511_34675 [Dorcoceras hygrometricum]
MESAVMTSALMSSQSAVGYQQMRREVKEMKRRRAEESADGLALMTSSVTSSHSADEKEEADKRKRVEKIIDSEDTEPLSKVLELTETSMSDEESMSIDDLLQQIPKEMMLPSVTPEEPTKIKFGRRIMFKEENWYKASLPKINTADEGKKPLVEEIKGNPANEMFTLIWADVDFLVQIREAVVEEISSFFYSFSLGSLSDLQSVSDIAKKEEQVLQWAETDSLQTAVQRRLYTITKIDLQVLILLSDAHRISLKYLLEQMRQHKLEWTRPCSSKLFERADVQSEGIHSRFYPSVKSTSWVRSLILIEGSWTVGEGKDPWWRCGCRSAISRKKKQQPQRPFVDAFAPICIFIEPVQDLDSRKPYSGIVQRNWEEICVDIVQFSLFGHLLHVGTYNFCKDIVEAGAVVDIDAVSTGIFNAFQHRLEVEEHIPQTSMPTAVVPSTDYTKSFAQLRASVDKIQFEQIQTRVYVDKLKAALSSKITGLEMRFAQVSSQHDMLLRAQIHDVRKEVQTQKAALSQDLDDFRKETHEGLNTLSSQLSQIIAYINRGRDDKKGEIESSRGPPPDDRSRPGSGTSRPSGGGSSSEPSRKRGGSYK